MSNATTTIRLGLPKGGSARDWVAGLVEARGVARRIVADTRATVVRCYVDIDRTDAADLVITWWADDPRPAFDALVRAFRLGTGYDSRVNVAHPLRVVIDGAPSTT